MNNKLKFYIQLNKTDHITDCLTTPHEGYAEAEFDTPLPSGFTGGWFKYLGDNEYELDEAKHSELNPPSAEVQLRADVDYIAIMTGVDLHV